MAAVGVDSANREARPSPWRALVVPDGFDPSVVDDAAIAALSALRTGVVRPALLPEYASLAGAEPSENTGVQEDSPGSNNWAISGRLTSSGKPIMANDPHRNVGNPSIRYIVHLTAPGWDVIGAVEHRFTRHGPVFHEDTVRHLAYAMRSTAHEPGSAGYLSALRSHAIDDCRQFLDAQRYHQAPTENMVCADVHGNIAWQASGLSPRRPNWHGRLPVPGHDGWYEWDGFRDDLPRELNPARGWIATANHDIHPEGYDPPLFFKAGPQRDRYDRIAQVLGARTGFTMRDMEALQHDAHSVSAARDLPLFRGWRSADAAVEQGRALLDAWNAQHRRESAAAALRRFVGRALPGEVRATGLPAAQRQVLLERALRTGLDSLRAVQGDDPAQWRWGRFNTSQLPHAFVKAYDIAPVERHGGAPAGVAAAVALTRTRYRNRARSYCGGQGPSTPSSRAACSGQRGFRSISRASSTRSASPSATMRSACAGSVISPTAAVGIAASCRTRRANGTWYPGSSAMRTPLTSPPDEQSIRSTPTARSRAASRTDSSTVQPPST